LFGFCFDLHQLKLVVPNKIKNLLIVLTVRILQLFVELSDELILVPLGRAHTHLSLTKLRHHRLDQTIHEFITFAFLCEHELPILLSQLGHIVLVSPRSVIKLQDLSDVILDGLPGLHLC